MEQSNQTERKRGCGWEEKEDTLWLVVVVEGSVRI